MDLPLRVVNKGFKWVYLMVSASGQKWFVNDAKHFVRDNGEN